MPAGVSVPPPSPCLVWRSAKTGRRHRRAAGSGGARLAQALQQRVQACGQRAQGRAALAHVRAPLLLRRPARRPRAPAVVQAMRGAPVQHLRREHPGLCPLRSRPPELGCLRHVALDAETDCTLKCTLYEMASPTGLRFRAHPQALLQAQRVAQRAAGAAPGVAAGSVRPLAGGRVQRAQYRHERVQAAQLCAQRARVDRPGARQRQRQPRVHLLARGLSMSVLSQPVATLGSIPYQSTANQARTRPCAYGVSMRHMASSRMLPWGARV